ncbi:hypothetical protein SOVF_176800 [Spinacia oleracea]|uniref:Acireductone dioxygenase n=1 Tax=Spinacia oleracea TaxID=3562 RepID=A0A9R0J7U0_SPIOL|nr:acireductone dioxygenase 2-like [Spinacia oleracea]KNA06904.1 hypothetical protein SOVF_176800 [Spinacia oleracea]
MLRKDPREEVIEAWYIDDDSNENPSLPYHKEPKEVVSLDQLAELGILTWKLDADNYETDEELNKIREARGYTYMDCICNNEQVPNYEEMNKRIYEEHLHSDDETRYCVDGSGYLDVRDVEDKWIRIWLKKGAMIVLPAGIYHRASLDFNSYIKLVRLFAGNPVWTPHNRPNDDLQARKEYVEKFLIQ